MLKLNLVALEASRALKKGNQRKGVESMIYKCSTCHRDLITLMTKGNEVNYDFTCAACIEVLRKNLERHKENGAFMKEKIKEKE